MKKILLAVCLCISVIGLIAQPQCGFDHLYNEALKDKKAAAAIAETNRQIREYIETHPVSPEQHDGNPIYTIPVVVHVVHTGGAVGSIYNPSDAQILGAIDYLNNVYNGTAPGAGAGVGDIQIQFKLAQRYGNCNPTTGIDRVDGSTLQSYTNSGVRLSGTQGVTDLNLKNFCRWDPTKYYNIYVVNKIDAKDGTTGTYIAGYAYFPGLATLQEDGAVVLATKFIAGEQTLPHELGHALNLYHTFQGSSGSTCPLNTDCASQGDLVCDTDPSTQTFACRAGTNPCTGFAYNANSENNMMSYTNCAALFTAGQKARTMAAMNHAYRVPLANSDADDPLDAGANPCPPKINFVTAAANVTETTDLSTDCRGYKDYTYNMSIGVIPNAPAIVTLSVSGTATEGADYILTTNNNFSAPSKVLVFPAEIKDNQSFKLRVFDDAAVEDNETIIINFTVDANGGNAGKGDGVPTSTITIKSTDNDFPDPSTGQTIESALNATGTAHFGPFDDVYFYTAGGTMMVRLKNFTDFNYGCTQIRIDRTGTGAKAFTSNTTSEYVTDKTVEVIPTFDKPNGSFEITLYFKASEASGWTSATGKTLFDAKLVKTPLAISSYTPGTVPPGVVRIATPATGSYGADHSLNATFNTSLKGGFAMGAPSIPAPVIYTFNGNGLWNNAANWANGSMPPASLPPGGTIIINPAVDGQCILNIPQTIQAGATIIVNANKQFFVQGNLTVED